MDKKTRQRKPVFIDHETDNMISNLLLILAAIGALILCYVGLMKLDHYRAEEAFKNPNVEYVIDGYSGDQYNREYYGIEE